jgi:hypothetical protein
VEKKGEEEGEEEEHCSTNTIGVFGVDCLCTSFKHQMKEKILEK